MRSCARKPGAAHISSVRPSSPPSMQAKTPSPSGAGISSTISPPCASRTQRPTWRRRPRCGPRRRARSRRARTRAARSVSASGRSAASARPAPRRGGRSASRRADRERGVARRPVSPTISVAPSGRDHRAVREHQLRRRRRRRCPSGSTRTSEVVAGIAAAHQVEAEVADVGAALGVDDHVVERGSPQCSARSACTRRPRRRASGAAAGGRVIETTSSEPSGIQPSPEGCLRTCITSSARPSGSIVWTRSAVEVGDPPAPVVPARPLEEGPTVEQCGQFAHRRHPTLRSDAGASRGRAGPPAPGVGPWAGGSRPSTTRDTYVCRPHQPGEIAPRWSATGSPARTGAASSCGWTPRTGPTLGLHLGMAGSIALEAPQDRPLWDRFTVEFDDGTPLRPARPAAARAGGAEPGLRPRRAGCGGRRPAGVPRADRSRRGAGQGPAARPGRDLGGRQPAGRRGALARPPAPAPAGRELSTEELDRLRRAVRAATREAIRDGGVHTGRFVGARGREGACPRCGHALARATLGGRTTYWCPECQG